MTKSRNLIAKKTKWTPEMDAYLVANYPTRLTAEIAAHLGISIEAVRHRAFRKHHLSKDRSFLDDPALSGRLDGTRGAENRLVPGDPRIGIFALGRKGIRCSPHSEFKKGQRPSNCMDVGAEKMHMGYVWVKTAEGGWPAAWRPKHHVVWRNANGGAEIPAGHIVAFKDGNSKNFDPSNLELTTRAERLKRTHIHNLPEDLRHTLQVLGALKRRINRASPPEPKPIGRPRGSKTKKAEVDG